MKWVDIFNENAITDNSNDLVIKDPDFQRWFGQSKIVDSSGQPLLVFHGTSKDFDRFDPDAEISNRKNDIKGLYFTSDPLTATSYAYASRRKTNGRTRVIGAYLKMENPLDITPLIKKYRKKKLTFGDSKRKALEQLDMTVHDGVIFKGDNYNVPEYIVFSPSQVHIVKG